jgi:pilus assembly protein FimV
MAPQEELWSPPTSVAKPASNVPMDPLPTTPDQPVAKPSAPEKVVEPAAQPALVPPARTIKWKQEDGVEVDDSVVDEVEVFMAHGHAELAISLLQEHVRATPDESPIPWMLLLDLLKRNKMAREYTEAGKSCKQYFNIRVPELNEDEPGPSAAGLEAYPHILSELTRLWKSPECQAYLDDLIFDRRGGTRVGFDPPTFREIMLLRTIQMDESLARTLQAQA